MRLWLAKNSEVPLREQLLTQVMLGIISDDLKQGQRLPSTRELARRFDIHPNTVSAVYRELARRGWVEFRKGSGVYVRGHAGDSPLDMQQENASLADTGLELDQLISTFLRIARERGFSLGEIQSRVKHWLEFQPPDHFLVIEPDSELRQILMVEIRERTKFPVSGTSLEDCAKPGLLTGASPVALYGQAENVRKALPPDTACLLLRSRSVPETLQGQKPASDDLIAVVSRWPEFLRWSRTILVAAGVDPIALSFRDAREPGWQRGLRSSAFVITDAVTARQLPEGCQARVFRIIADSSLDELQNFVEQFLTK